MALTIDQVNLMKISAAEGTYTIADTDLVTVDFVAIYIAEDTVINNLYLNGGTTNAVLSYVKVPATAVKGGTIIAIGTKAGYGSSIQLTSGSVTLILK